MKLGKCDICNNQRYLKLVHDEFGVDVLARCAYGCNDNRSIPTKECVEMDKIAKCHRCTGALKPENEIYFNSYLKTFFCSESCNDMYLMDGGYFYTENFDYYNATSTIPITCNAITKEDLKLYKLFVENNRIFIIEE